MLEKGKELIETVKKKTCAMFDVIILDINRFIISYMLRLQNPSWCYEDIQLK